MNKTKHIIMGFVVSILFVALMHYFFNWYTFSALDLIIMVIIITIYSLLPDIDHKMGTITWWFLGIGILMLIYGVLFNFNVLLLGIALLVLTFLCAHGLSHRGVVHSIPAGLMFASLLFIQLNYKIVSLAFVAFYSHLLADKLPFKFK